MTILVTATTTLGLAADSKANDVVRKGSEYTAADIAQGRDLSLYDKGGHFLASGSNLPKIRAFIWRHWHNKQRGYIRVTVSGADWPATLHFFIEPDRQGAWHIALRVASSHTYPPSEPNRVSDQPIIFSVARVKRKEFDNLGSYVLTFKASDGSELLRL
jgi:hypothetical protein